MTFIRERAPGMERIFGISRRRDARLRTGSTDGRASEQILSFFARGGGGGGVSISDPSLVLRVEG